MFHHIQHVHVLFRLGIYCDRRATVLIEGAGGIPQDGVDGRNIEEMNGLAAAPREDHVVKALNAVFAGKTQSVGAPANIGESAGNVVVVAGQTCKSRYVDTESCRAIRVKCDSHFALAPAVDVSSRDTGDLLYPGLNDFLDKILIAGDIRLDTR